MNYYSKKYLFILLGILLILALIFAQKMVTKNKATVKITPTQSANLQKPDMLLSFTPHIVNAGKNGSFSSKLTFNTYGNPAAGVTIQISYDSKKVTGVSLKQYKDSTSALSNALVNSYSVENIGSITTVYATPPNIPEQKGTGDIATLSGILLPGVTGAEITISTSTAVSRSMSKVALGKVNLEIHR